MWISQETLLKVLPLNDHSSSPLKPLFSNSIDGIPGNHVNVFLPGWGFNGRIITLQHQVTGWVYPDKVIPPEETIKNLYDYLEANNINSATLTGWSMGAYIALDFALEYPEKIDALYLVAMRKSWPEKEIGQIRNDLLSDRDSFLQTFYRKCFLGYRKQYDIFRSEMEADLKSGLDHEALETGLKYLADYNTGERFASLKKHHFPVHIINGAKDIIAPINESPTDDEIVSVILDHGGHPVFLEQDFPFHLHQRKKSIRSKFCRAADTYDQNAIIQKQVAEKLGNSLPATPPKKILEIGCGTGNFTSIINNRYPGAEITAIDFAEEMLNIAREKVLTDKPIRYLACDGEKFLTDSEERFDLITSNATLQWFDNLAASSRNMRALLADGGNILLSIFGSESMKEMRHGLKKITGKDVQLPATFFPDRDRLFKIFPPLFRELEIDEWQIVKDYDSMAKLLEHIRRTGTSGWHPGKPLLTRKRISTLEDWFLAEYGKCCITYQIFQVKGLRK